MVSVGSNTSKRLWDYYMPQDDAQKIVTMAGVSHGNEELKAEILQCESKRFP